MARIAPLTTSVLLMLWSLTAAAGDAFPRVVFPAGYALPVDAQGVVTADTAVLQLELNPGLVLSARRDAQFALARSDGGTPTYDLRVLRGALIAIDIQSNTVVELPPGRYGVSPNQGAAPAIVATPGDMPHERQRSSMGADAEAMSPGYRLSDAVMTQQQKYLDSLKIDIRDINSALASIIRSLVPRR